MSLSATAIGEAPVSAQPAAQTSSKTKAPPKRKITAKADLIDQPEAR